MNKSMFEVLAAFDQLFENSIFPESFFADRTVSYVCPSFPPVNVSVDKEKKDLRFELAMAGIEEDRVSLTFSGDFMELTIEPKEKDKSERSYLVKGIKEVSKLTNKYYVPISRYDVSAVKAEFNNGMLIIDIPVKEDAKPKKIDIKVSK